MFAQDKWTVKRLTLNAGIRFDYLDIYFPETTLGPAPLTPTRNLRFPEQKWVSFKDITPRLGGAVDVFGNGKTAFKMALNKYVIAQGLQGIYGDSGAPVEPSRQHRLADLERQPVSGRRPTALATTFPIANCQSAGQRRMRDHVHTIVRTADSSTTYDTGGAQWVERASQ